MHDLTVPRYGITGTDTGIGKTVVACALAVRARQLGIRVAAMKPVESGIDARGVPNALPPSDAHRLQWACGGGDALSLMRPYVLEEPLAPMVAAQRAGVTIDLDVLDHACRTLATDRDLLLVEGAGGLLVPITPTFSFLDLFARWRCPLIIVAGNRLGVLNHVLLTVRAAQSAQVPVRAVILSDGADGEPGLAEVTNFEALATLLPQIPRYRFPWVDRIDDADTLASAAQASGFDAILLDHRAVLSSGVPAGLFSPSITA